MIWSSQQCRERAEQAGSMELREVTEYEFELFASVGDIEERNDDPAIPMRPLIYVT